MTNSLPAETPSQDPMIQSMVYFFFEVGLLRHKDRTWDSLIGVEMANVAEHKLRVAWLAAYLVLREGGAIEEALMAMGIAMFHDAGELRTGDQNPFMKAYVTVDEESAVKDLLAPTLPIFGQFMAGLYKAYKERNTLAARCVKDADILDSAFELIELESTGHMYPKVSRNQLEIKYNTYFTEAARELHAKLVELGPESRWDFRNAIESTFKRGLYGK